MRSLSLISVALILIVAFYSCHKSSVNANTTYINSITKSHKWTGYFSKGIVSPVGAGNFGLQAYNHNVADTTFPITELTYQLASIPFWSEPLKYKSTDANPHPFFIGFVKAAMQHEPKHEAARVQQV